MSPDSRRYFVFFKESNMGLFGGLGQLLDGAVMAPFNFLAGGVNGVAAGAMGGSPMPGMGGGGMGGGGMGGGMPGAVDFSGQGGYASSGGGGILF
jgi:hypothetical protein